MLGRLRFASFSSLPARFLAPSFFFFPFAFSFLLGCSSSLYTSPSSSASCFPFFTANAANTAEVGLISVNVLMYV